MARDRLHLNAAERFELESRSRSQADTEDSRRARLILLIDAGIPFREIQRTLNCNEHYILRWKRRFLAERLAGLYSRHAGRRPTVESEQLVERIERVLANDANAGRGAWSGRQLARALGVHPVPVSRALARIGRLPAPARRDPGAGRHPAEREIAAVLGIYLNPPQHAIIFQREESSLVQLLQQIDGAVLFSLGQDPLAADAIPGEAAREIDDLIRSSRLFAPCCGRHTSAEFTAFLAATAAHHGSSQLEVLADNPATARCIRLRRYLADHHAVHLEAVPSVGAWLDRIEQLLATAESGRTASRMPRGFGSWLAGVLRQACEERIIVKWFLRRPD